MNHGLILKTPHSALRNPHSSDLTTQPSKQTLPSAGGYQAAASHHTSGPVKRLNGAVSFSAAGWIFVAAVVDVILLAALASWLLL